VAEVDRRGQQKDNDNPKENEKLLRFSSATLRLRTHVSFLKRKACGVDPPSVNIVRLLINHRSFGLSSRNAGVLGNSAEQSPASSSGCDETRRFIVDAGPYRLWANKGIFRHYSRVGSIIAFIFPRDLNCFLDRPPIPRKTGTYLRATAVKKAAGKEIINRTGDTRAQARRLLQTRKSRSISAWRIRSSCSAFLWKALAIFSSRLFISAGFMR
jgi:hypothetical protein